MKKAILLCWLMSLAAGVLWAQNPEKIVRACIRRHGGERKFKAVRDFYAKLDVCTYSSKGDIESTFYEYFRLPDKLRMEIHPLIDPPTKLSWDGHQAWQMVKRKNQRLQEQKQIDRIKDSVRFFKFLILTNLLDGKNLRYGQLAKYRGQNVHRLEQTTAQGERLNLYIGQRDAKLLAVDFTWQGRGARYQASFYRHKIMAGLLLPYETRVFKDGRLIMKAFLKKVRINALANSNSFFRDLGERPRWKSSRRGRGRRGRR